MKNRSVARAALFVLVVVSMVSGIRHPLVTVAATENDYGQQFILCAPEDRIAAVAGRHNLTVIRPVDEHIRSVVLVRGPVPQQQTNAVQGDTLDTATQQLLQEVRNDPDVQHFDLNGESAITELGQDLKLNESTIEILDSLEKTITAFFGQSVWTPYVAQPATGLLKLTQAQQMARGDGIVVAVIDTGVDPHHPALQGVVVPGYDFTRDVPDASEWSDLDESTIEILDSTGVSVLDPSAPVPVNGTTVAMVDSATLARVDVTRLPRAFGHGTMVAGLIHLVAPTAKIMPLKAFNADGSSNAFNVLRAIYYAVDHGAKVINMSFSSVTTSAELTHAIDYATSHGVLCLASAGNSGKRLVVFPAGYRNVIAVGATTMTDTRAAFSNHGDHLVKVAAPGEALITLYPGRRYAAVSGTSFSTALVTGGAALLAQRAPSLDFRSAGRFFDYGAVKVPELEMGDGRIDLREALKSFAPLPPPADTTAPTVTFASPAAGATVIGVYPLAVNTNDNVGVTSVQYRLDGVSLGDVTATPFGMNWDSKGALSGPHVLGAVARDAAGNQSETSVTINVSNDTTAPTVMVSSPAAGAIVRGLVTLGATASDNVGVVGVQFRLDGVNVGAEVTTAPYQLTWNSGSVANGEHVFVVVARDAAGNSTVAPSVRITVDTDTIAPTVAVTNPLGLTPVAGTITLAATAADNVGVAGVQ
jgi:thermitase